MSPPIDQRPPASARRLLTAGVVAGPLFVVLVLVQLATTAGFDLRRHPISLLSLGDQGWIQIANFVVSGLLAIVFAVGLRRSLAGRGRTWGPLLVGGFGLGLVAGGVFLADPALGFPPGAPDGIPSAFSWHGTIHAIAPPAAGTSLIAACFVFVRRFVDEGERGWAAYSAATGLVVLAFTLWPDLASAGVRLFLATAIGWAWVFALAVRLTGRPDRAPATTHVQTT